MEKTQDFIGKYVELDLEGSPVNTLLVQGSKMFPKESCYVK
jgi:hypothetical protein